MLIALLLLIHIASTIMMCGIIWAVQCVEYPMFADVGEADFKIYHDNHMRRITWVAGPLMLAEVFSGAALILASPSAVSIPLVQQLSALGLLIYIWVVTALSQIPAHRALMKTFSTESHRRLVRGNWQRTIAWTLRAIVVLTWATHFPKTINLF